MTPLPNPSPITPTTQSGGRRVWLPFVALVSISVMAFAIFILNRHTSVPASWGVETGARNGLIDGLSALQQCLLSPLTMGAFGTLILSRRPGHRIGWLLVGLGWLSALGQLAQEWTVYGYFTVGVELPGAGLAAWVANWIWIILFGVLLFMAALFPDGQFPARRWRWVVGLPLLLFIVTVFIAAALEPELSSAFQIPNPFFTYFPLSLRQVLLSSGDFGAVLMPMSVLTVLLSAIARFRQSHTRERQQMKWLLFGVTLMATMTVVGLILEFGLNNRIGALLVNAATLGPPVGVGIALARHRLYDVDLIIRRTLIYGVLTALLGAAFFGSVVVLQALFRGVTGELSNIAIVASTLGIFALALPLRNAVQRVIDRRFFRSKYNAEQSLARFSVEMRDAVALDEVTGKLLDAVDATLQPEKMALWVAKADGRRNQP